MRHEGSLIDDVLKLGESLLAAFLDTRHDLKQEIVDRVEVFATRFDLVRREEFDALHLMLAKTRAEQSALTEKLESFQKAKRSAAKKKEKPTAAKAGKASLKKKNTRPKTLLSVKHGNRRKARTK
jgi:BMFP domain-containing protein YqiC